MDEHIKDVLGKFVRQSKLNDGVYTQRIRKYWNERMGDTITSRTRKLNYSNGILTIYVESSSLRQELFSTRNKIREIINEHFEGQQIVTRVLIK